MRPIRNFKRPRTIASLLRGSVLAKARTSSIVTTAVRAYGRWSSSRGVVAAGPRVDLDLVDRRCESRDVDERHARRVAGELLGQHRTPALLIHLADEVEGQLDEVADRQPRRVQVSLDVLQ